jgi:hypothetical protein
MESIVYGEINRDFDLKEMIKINVYDPAVANVMEL